MAARKRPAAGRPKSRAPRAAVRAKSARPKAAKSARRKPAKPKRRVSAKTARQRPRKQQKPAKSRQAKTAARKPVRTARTKTAPKGAARKPPAFKPRPSAVPKPARRSEPTPTAKPAAARPRTRTPVAPKPTRAEPPTTLARSRRTLPDDERLEGELVPGGLPDDRMISSARTGHDELQQLLRNHTETSPRLTAGDVDAKWQDAYAVGDEAPGGDNQTPDQDRVEDIGRALGITYADDQELEGGEEIEARDRERWELDPASADDWPHDKDED